VTILAATAPLAIEATPRALVGEGPVWDVRRQVLWWVDIEGSQIFRFDPAQGVNTSFSAGERASAVAVCEDGNLLVARQQGLATYDPDRDLTTAIQNTAPHPAGHRFNDGKCDHQGRFWIGTMPLDEKPCTTAGLYVLDADRNLVQRLSSVGLSNGLAWSADGRSMFYVDSQRSTIDVFDFDVDAETLGDRRPIFRVPSRLGAADGLTIDSEDNLWVAFWGGGCVLRIDPRREEITQEIRLPVRQVSSCTFGGADLRDLYITTARIRLSAGELREQPLAGHLFKARPGCQGVAPDRHSQAPL
jgi:sugar lactone lactonase YvrE